MLYLAQAKCQKSYLFNTLVIQELIINLSLHSRSTKIIIIPHVLIITFKIIDPSRCKTDQPKPGPFSLTIQPRKQKALGTRLVMNMLVKLGGIMYVKTVPVYIYNVHTCTFFLL
jgi:hypothetical protein